MREREKESIWKRGVSNYIPHRWKIVATWGKKIFKKFVIPILWTIPFLYIWKPNIKKLLINLIPSHKLLLFFLLFHRIFYFSSIFKQNTLLIWFWANKQYFHCKPLLIFKLLHVVKFSQKKKKTRKNYFYFALLLHQITIKLLFCLIEQMSCPRGSYTHKK